MMAFMKIMLILIIWKLNILAGEESNNDETVNYSNLGEEKKEVINNELVEGVFLNLGVCAEPLGMESGKIRDENLNATSSRDEYSVGPRSSRIRNTVNGGGWCPNGLVTKISQDYLEIDLEDIYIITYLETAGRYRGQEYTSSYIIYYWRPPLYHWMIYRDYHEEHVLQGNEDAKNSKLYKFDLPFAARKIRIKPYSFHPRTVCLRVELYGCNYTSAISSYLIPYPVSEFGDLNYDGKTNGNNIMMEGGLGQLTDKVLGYTNITSAYSFMTSIHFKTWVGWSQFKVNATKMDIILDFVNHRELTFVKLNVMNFPKLNIQIFKSVEVMYSMDNHTDFISYKLLYPPESYDYEEEGAVDIILRTFIRVAKRFKLQFHFKDQMIFMSEIHINSVPVVGNITEIITEEMESIDNKSSKKPILGTFEVIKNTNMTENHNNDDKPFHISHTAIIMFLGVFVFIVTIVLIYIRRNGRRISNDNITTLVSRGNANVLPYCEFLKSRELNLLPSVQLRASALLRTNQTISEARALRIQAELFNINNCGINNFNSFYNSPSELIRDDSRSQPPQNFVSNFPSYNAPQSRIENILLTETRDRGNANQNRNRIQYSRSFRNLRSPTLTRPITFLDDSSVSYDSIRRNESLDIPVVMQQPCLSSVQHSTETKLIPIFTKMVFPANIFVPNVSTKCKNIPGVTEINLDVFTMTETIGNANFGKIYIGYSDTVSDLNGQGIKVPKEKFLIKRMHHSLLITKKQLISEAFTVAQISHSNICRLIAIFKNTKPYYIAQEYGQFGELKVFLQDKNPLDPTLGLNFLMSYVMQIAAGLAYLSSINIVHRDLAARNCVISEKYQVKISDHATYDKRFVSDYYQIEDETSIRRLPIRWMAWESVHLNEFSTHSDVWSFGVTLWEIFTLCRETPYENYQNSEIIKNCARMSKSSKYNFPFLKPPKNKPKEFYALMKSCWVRDPHDRKRITDILLWLKMKCQQLPFCPNTVFQERY